MELHCEGDRPGVRHWLCWWGEPWPWTELDSALLSTWRIQIIIISRLQHQAGILGDAATIIIIFWSFTLNLFSLQNPQEKKSHELPDACETAQPRLKRNTEQTETGSSDLTRSSSHTLHTWTLSDFRDVYCFYLLLKGSIKHCDLMTHCGSTKHWISSNCWAHHQPRWPVSLNSDFQIELYWTVVRYKSWLSLTGR